MPLITGTLLDDALVLTTGVSLDILTGLAGNDVILVALPGDLAAGDKIDGGTGYDRLWFTATGPATLTLLSSVTLIEMVQIVDAAGNSSGTDLINVNASALAAVATGFTLTGNDGANQLTGTAGKDLIVGNGGADNIAGGAGADRIVMSVAAGNVDQIDAGVLSELNTLVLVGAATARIVIDLSEAGDQLAGLALNQSGFASLDASAVTAFGVEVTGSTLKNVIVGSAQDDVFLFGSPAALGVADLVSGGGGNDTLRFTSITAGQTLLLTATVSVESAEIANAAGATAGATSLNINALAVKPGIKLTGNDGNNSLTGGVGNDTLNGNFGNDTLTGGAGNDVYEVDSQGDMVALDRITETATGGTDDRIVFTSTTAGDTLLLGSTTTGIEAVYLSNLAFSTAGTTALDVNGAALLTRMSYFGNAGNNLLAGGTGNDTFTGGAGADTIVGGAGADRVVMGIQTGNIDQIDAGALTEFNTLVLVGAATGTVLIDLNSTVDQLTDGDGRIQIGFANVDASGMTGFGVQVNASTLKNVLVGTGTDDVFVIVAGAHLTSADRITGGGGDDVLRFASTTAGQTLTLAALNLNGVKTVEIADATGDTTGMTALNVAASTLRSGLSFVGNDGANKFIGGLGSDTFNGNDGVDVLTGGAGADVFLVDLLADYDAGDAMAGGLGTDVLRFTSTTGGEILILNSLATGIETVQVSDAAGLTTGTTMLGINASAVSTALHMVGNDGDNTLVGTKANDTINGGIGADSINGGLGNDSIDGGEGIDTVVGGTGRDVITTVAEEMDEIHAGLVSEDNLLRLTGATSVIMNLNLADQVLSGAGVQDGITFVDASGLEADPDPLFPGVGLVIAGRTTTKGDNIIGSARIDSFTPGAGADTIEGGGADDNWFVASDADMAGDLYTDAGGTVGDYIHFTSTMPGATLHLKDATVTSGIDAASTSGSANINIDASGLSTLGGFGLSGNSGNNVLTGTAGRDTFFDYGGRDTMIGGLGPDSYVVQTWDPFDRIIDSGGFDEFYYGAVAGVFVVSNSALGSVDLFAVSSDGLNTEGVGIYTRDITVTYDAGIDARAVTHSIHLAGSYGDNELTATSANDTIIGWKGQDTISGRNGNDDITMDVGAGDIDQIDAGESSGDLDRLFLQGEPGGVVEVDLANTADQITFIDGAPETLAQTGFEGYVDASKMARPAGAPDAANYGVILKGTALTGRDTLIGTGEDDVFIGRGGGDSMSGNAGDDAFVLTSLAEFTGDTLNGGADNDAVWFSSTTAGQTLTLNPLALTAIEEARVADASGAATGTTALNINASLMTSGMKLVGNNGANSMAGTAFADTITGDGGVDTVIGGADTLVGGAGDDLYLVNSGLDVVAGDRINEAVSGGTDTLRFVSLVDGDSVTLTALMTGLEKVEIHDGPDTLVGSLALDVDASLLPKGVLFSGSKFANQLAGTAFADTINAGLGNDTIMAGAGADVITMSVLAADMDDVDGGAIAEGNKLILLGDPGGDMVWDLSSGTDQLLTVNALDDGRIFLDITSIDASALEGGFAVTISGSAEANILVGTAQNDVFITATPFVAGEKITAGLGDDILRFSSTTGGQTLVLTGLITGVETVEISDAFGDTSGTSTLGLNAALAPNALAITANDGNNAITGTIFADTITGGAGADTITGLGGADVITVGVDVADTVNAGALIEGNKLVLTGAAAADLVFNLTLATGSQFTGGSMSGFTHLDASAVTGFGVQVTGSAAANEIIGTAQADTITGGLGADSIGVDLGGLGDTIDAGLAAEGNTLVLSGTAGSAVLDLSVLVGDQLDMTGTQGGFMHVDASALGGTGLNVTGSAAANRITGSAQADTILGGGGADVITFDLNGVPDFIDAGGFGEGNKLVLAGNASAAFNVDLSATADQLADVADTQTGFQHVDASAMGAFGLNARGNGLNNHFVGSLFGDTLIGGAGADRFVLGGGKDGDGVADRVVYERPGDGVNSIGGAFGYDRVFDFKAGVDKIVFGGQFNGGASNLDDIADNNSFVFALDEKADFSTLHEAMLITAEKSGVSQLNVSNFASVVASINNTTAKRGVIAATGDDGLILVQGTSGTGDNAISRTGIYYYQEMDGIFNKVSAGELILLGVVEGKISNADVLFV